MGNIVRYSLKDDAFVSDVVDNPLSNNNQVGLSRDFQYASIGSVDDFDHLNTNDVYMHLFWKYGNDGAIRSCMPLDIISIEEEDLHEQD